MRPSPTSEAAPAASRATPLLKTAAIATTTSAVFLLPLGLLQAIVEVTRNGFLEYEAYHLAELGFEASLNLHAACAVALGVLVMMGDATSRRGRNRGGDSRSPRTWLAAEATIVSVTLTFTVTLVVGCLFPRLFAFVGAPASMLLSSDMPSTYVVLGIVTVAVVALPCAKIVRRQLHLRVAWALSRFARRTTARLVGGSLLVAMLVLDLSSFGLQKDDGAARPNVVLITIDTLKASHLSCYGHERLTSPHIDELARRGTLFEMAISQAPWTKPSLASIHTSTYPAEHGAVGWFAGIPESDMLLAESFQNAGYATLAVVSHVFAGRPFGFAQGFDYFDDHYEAGHRGSSSAELTDSALALLEEVAGQRFFLWIHYFDPHFDYVTHAEYPFGAAYSGHLSDAISIYDLVEPEQPLDDADLAYVLDVYDGEIAFTDRHIGRLLGGLQSLGLESSTIVALTADHGEAFSEHSSFGHGEYLYQEAIHVPLILYDPRRPAPPSPVPHPVELRHLAMTLAHASGISAAQLQGLDLFAIASGDLEPGPVYSQGGPVGEPAQRALAVLNGDQKLIYRGNDDSYELYDLATDAGETVNLFRDEHSAPKTWSMLQAWAKSLDDDAGRGPAAMLSSDVTERLRALGYLE